MQGSKWPRARWWVACCLALTCFAGLAVADEPPRLVLDAPLARSTLGGPDEVLVAGRWIARTAHQGVDVLLLLDTSESMARPSGFDLDLDGRIGSEGLAALFNDVRDPGDQWLTLALNLARGLTRGLDPERDRAALATFAGTVPGVGADAQPRVMLEQGMTEDFERIRGALHRLRDSTPRGRTDLASGLDVARNHFSSLANDGRHAVVFVLTDGEVTASGPRGAPGVGLAAADRALLNLSEEGIEVQVLALRSYGRSPSPPLRQHVERRGGSWHVFEGPYDLPRVQQIRLDGLQQLEIVNLTTEIQATESWQALSGGFGALLPLVPGPNRIRVTGVSESGERNRVERTVHYRPGADRDSMPRLSELFERLRNERWLRLEAERVAAAKRARTHRQLEIRAGEQHEADAPRPGDG